MDGEAWESDDALVVMLDMPGGKVRSAMSLDGGLTWKADPALPNAAVFMDEYSSIKDATRSSMLLNAARAAVSSMPTSASA